jgi:dynein heavy chain
MADWFQAKVSMGLGTDSTLFDKMLNKKAFEIHGAIVVELDNCPAQDAINTFLSDKTSNGGVLFFWQSQGEDEVAKHKASLAFGASEAKEAKEGVADDSAVAAANAAATTLRTEEHCNVALGSLPEAAYESRTMYFIKNTDGKVSSGELSAVLEWGVLTGKSLSNLSFLVKEIFIPMLDPQQMSAGQEKATSAEESASSEKANTVGTEFSNNIQKFSAQISNAIQQTSGDIHLQIPDIVIDNPGDVTDDYEIVSQLDIALEDWSKAVANVVEQENLKVVQGSGPLAEIEFWRERNAALSTLYEQINMPNVQKMLDVLKLVESSSIPSFVYHFSELTKLYVEAKDNVKFLTTLERHFKNITSGNLSTIQDTLPSMMNAIRMVWIISRHYNTDERMVPLMERIAHEIASKVAMDISIPGILHKSPEVALRTIHEAKSVLKKWSKTYKSVREKNRKVRHGPPLGI